MDETTGSLDGAEFSALVVVVVLASAVAERIVSELHSSKHSSKVQALTDGNDGNDNGGNDNGGNDNDNDNGDTILVVFRSAKSESSSVLVDSLLFLYLNLYLCLYFASRNVTLRYRVVLGVVGRDVYF